MLNLNRNKLFSLIGNKSERFIKSRLKKNIIIRNEYLTYTNAIENKEEIIFIWEQ